MVNNEDDAADAGAPAASLEQAHQVKDPLCEPGEEVSGAPRVSKDDDSEKKEQEKEPRCVHSEEFVRQEVAQDDDSDSDDPANSEGCDVDDDGGIDGDDGRTETCATDTDVIGSADNEIEQHRTDVAAATTMSHSALLEASRTVLFRRYSKMTPMEVESQERSYNTEFAQDVGISTMDVQCVAGCPEAMTQSCRDPACAEQLQWRDARIAELQAALDHMTEAMAIQQRDMAAQRVFLSRQAEQLTNLSVKLHQEKVSLHIERERFQKSMTITSSSKASTAVLGNIKSPVKKILSAAGGRRTTLAAAERVSSAAVKLYSSSVSNFGIADSSRSSSSSQLRLNPLVLDQSNSSLGDRSTSLSVLERRTSSDTTAIAITPQKPEQLPVPRAAAFTAKLPVVEPPTETGMMDVNLNEGCTPSLNVASPSHATTESTGRIDRTESSSCPTPDQKKLSLGDRFRSIRWGRS